MKNQRGRPSNKYYPVWVADRDALIEYFKSLFVGLPKRRPLFKWDEDDRRIRMRWVNHYYPISVALRGQTFTVLAIASYKFMLWCHEKKRPALYNNDWKILSKLENED